MVWRNWPKYLDGCPVWTAATGLKKANIKIFLCQSDSQWQDNHFEHRKCPKSPLQAKVMMVWKNQQNAFSVTLFKQLPRAEIGPKFKNFCAHQIANDKTIVLSPENPQKVHSRPKLWAFEKVVAKLYSKWELPSLNGRHGPNFWRNSKIFAPIR